MLESTLTVSETATFGADLVWTAGTLARTGTGSFVLGAGRTLTLSGTQAQINAAPTMIPPRPLPAPLTTGTMRMVCAEVPSPSSRSPRA